MKVFEEDDFVSAIHDAGQAFANDYDDGLNGKFAFSLGDYDEEMGGFPLTASWQSGLEEDEEVEGRDGDYGPDQTQLFWLVPAQTSSKPQVDGENS